MRRADNLTTCICRSSRNLGAPASWSPQGLSRSVMGLLYLYHSSLSSFCTRVFTLPLQRCASLLSLRFNLISLQSLLMLSLENDIKSSFISHYRTNDIPIYGFVPDIAVASSPSSNTVAMLKSVMCA